MSNKCPLCCEVVKFDPGKFEGRVRKCPHCHEFVHPEINIIQLVNEWCVKRLADIRMPKKISLCCLYMVLAALAGLIVAVIPGILSLEHWPPSWIIGVVVFLIVLLVGTRPGNIQPAVIIAFVTLLFVGMGNLWQKQNFELRNRPYIQILDEKFDLRMTGSYRWVNESNPEPTFLLSWSLINHGPVPARIESIRIQGHSEKKKIGTLEAISIGPYENDRLSQWTSPDIFPASSNEVSSVHSREVEFFLGADDAENLFGISLNKKKIFENEQFKIGKFDSPYLKSMTGRKFKTFYMLVQLEYHALGETGKEKNPYWYWVLLEHQDGRFVSVDSGISEVIKASKRSKLSSVDNYQIEATGPASNSTVKAVSSQAQSQIPPIRIDTINYSGTVIGNQNGQAAEKKAMVNIDDSVSRDSVSTNQR